MRLAVVGASGRMGRAVVRLAIEQKLIVAHAIASSNIGADAGALAGINAIGVAIADDLETISKVDAIIDFSSPSATASIASTAVKANAALVSGTTGLDDVGRAGLANAARAIPVMWEPNMSVGIALLSRLLEQAARALPDADIEIVETHHRLKVDAPSGTALRLAEIAQKTRTGRGTSSHLVTGREGKPGERKFEEIGVLAVRGGDVIGDHVAYLLMNGERIELTHRATSRDLFAHGALRAARFLVGKPAGTYTLNQIL